ncbi:hypothetical protein JCM8202_002117 [Rhodotorula sphaerocarpa]
MSKYATLPDIDTGADVFETPDVPAEISYSLEIDSDEDYHLPRAGSPTAARRARAYAEGQPASEDIDAVHLDATEARRRFGAATLASLNRRGQGSSSRPPNRRPLPSATVYTAGEDPDEREKETPLERLRRLRLELTELEEEVRRTDAQAPEQNVSSSTEGVSGGAQSAGEAKTKQKREVSPAVILQQLQLLRGDLQGLSPQVEGVLEADGELAYGAEGAEPEGPLSQKAKSTAGLLARLGAPDASTGAQASMERVEGPPASSGEKGHFASSSGDVEKRVSALETFLGATEADVDEVHAMPSSLLSSVARLDHLLTLLTQPRHLDSVSRRVKVLVSDLERIHESRRKLGDTRPLNVALSGTMTLSTGSDDPASGRPGADAVREGTDRSGKGGAALPPDALQKIDALFSLLPRLDPLLPLAPRLVARLQSLASLHSTAAFFGESLADLRRRVDALGESEEGLKEVVDGLERSFEQNEARVQGNMEAMDKRVEDIVRRLDRLAA